MSPPKQSAQLFSNPTADDLVFLLSIVSSPNRFIAEREHNQAQNVDDVPTTQSSGGDGSSTWERKLSSLPIRRRGMILSLQRLANARQKWTDSPSREKNSDSNGRFELEERLQNNNEADALEEVESAALDIRVSTTEFLESAKEYMQSLKRFWIDPFVTSPRWDGSTSPELERVGYQLALQLKCQIQWDERLAHSILAFLDEELYGSITADEVVGGSKFDDDRAATGKLRVWADAMSGMIKINKSFWEFVEREVYDETELEQNKENPAFLNGEPSSQIVTIGPAVGAVTESDCNHQENLTTNVDKSTSESYCAKEDISLHERIVSSSSVEAAIQTFIQSKYQARKQHDLQQKIPSITSILLMGEEGCGKSHFLDSIQQQIFASDTSIKVIRPKYPVDLVGNIVGSSEDRLIGLFTYASRIVSTASGNGLRKCLIMLDDIDQIFSLSDDINEQSPQASSSTLFSIGRRCKALFLTILDSFREHLPSATKGGGHLLLLCTSRSRCAEVIDRFDRTFRRGPPDETHRRQLITSCLSFGNADNVNDAAEYDDSTVESKLSLIVYHSTGRSAFELSQCCREALLICAKSTSTSAENDIFLRRLQCLDKMLQTKSPRSLRGGSLDGIVDMRVYTPEELQSKLANDTNGEAKMPLLGAEAKRAYEALMNVVITPLCRSDEIRSLLYGGRNNDQGVVDAKPIRVGALLTGSPGTGKTSLAYHCASLAAKMSRVSLLDVSCTSLIHKEIGGSERAVQHLFAAVRAAAPCILLLDGIENVAPCRGNDNTSEGTMDRVLSTFLTEMDGIETGGDGVSGNVAVIGVTHDPDLIDPSLLRPGRLEKTIALGVPDFEARKAIVAGQIRDIEIDFSSAGYFDPKSKDDLSKFVAMDSAGMSAVEVIAICREASMECLRELDFEATKEPILTYQHFKRGKISSQGK